MSDFILVCDQGSSASKAFLVDAAGEIKAEARCQLAAKSPAPGHWEHDAAEIFLGQRQAALEAIEQLPAGSRIAGLGITNQRSTVVAWDAATSQPLNPALSWQDLRGGDFIRELAPKASRIQELTGLRLEPYYTVSKLVWLLENVPAVKEAAARGRLRWGTVNTWLIWNLTDGAVWATDHTNAARTLLLNLNRLDWDNELQKIFNLEGIPLPELHPSCDYYGDAVLDGHRIPICASVGDQQAALLGQGATAAGDALINFGTLGAVLVMTGAAPAPRKGLLLSIAFSDAEQARYLWEGTVNAAGNLLTWLTENLELIRPGEDVDALCRRSGERLFFSPALVGLAAPHWRRDAATNFLGLTRLSTRADLVRAAVESISFSIAEIFAVLNQKPAVPVNQIWAGGGLANLEYLLQFTADLTGKPIYQSRQTEVTAKGAAFLAGVKCGLWRDLEQVKEFSRAQTMFAPRLDQELVKKLMSQWKESLEVAVSWHRTLNTEN